ncbi:hypothetical protein HZS_7920 [Henneguya salminicola]|nr:hypothetical protein HZS_7920 [Henneguya salminicola]
MELIPLNDTSSKIKNIFLGFISFIFTIFYLRVLGSDFWKVEKKYYEDGKIEIINYGLYFLCSNSSENKICVPMNEIDYEC